MQTYTATITGESFPAMHQTAITAVRRNSFIIIAGFAAATIYLLYIFFSFNIGTLLVKSKPERAALLATDAVAHKVHVTKHLRGDSALLIAVEGERTATYTTPPEWIKHSGDMTDIDLGKGYHVALQDRQLVMTVPDYGPITVQVTQSGVETTLPEGKTAPEWLSSSAVKFDARPTMGRRVQVSKTRIEVHRYFLGWENFFFPFRSELAGYSAYEVAKLAVSGQRLQEDIPNWKLILTTFWNNPDWQHHRVFIALLETFLMAVLGTLTAALVGLPLAILAASNFTPSKIIRFGVRRFFDFLRGIDMLIWSLIFIRAFGLGPLTGALAIAFTDTGSLGKLFSEALENVNKRQMEGVHATGANRWQFYRFGVLPQIIPVFVSQCLYYLESNIRSATIIGALGAGGIGLLLVETINTQRDWENTFYLILLTISLVMLMDTLSSKLRNRLIHGSSKDRVSQ
ncbi:MAG: phosphonate ABC transporter, permease protein PhnE [Desulfopila sp.]|jgi:phosphonate transport system permease protein|nr:phosphonate ABC transporter, permease protein PhnE [Desulfopila sp.]